MDELTIKHVTEIIRDKGTDAWWEMDLVDLLPPEHRDKVGSSQARSPRRPPHLQLSDVYLGFGIELKLFDQSERSSPNHKKSAPVHVESGQALDQSQHGA